MHRLVQFIYAMQREVLMLPILRMGVACLPQDFRRSKEVCFHSGHPSCLPGRQL
jgi:hypothetical protein